MADKNTKEHILQIGAEIIHEKGFNHTGIQEILKAAYVPKGSFYFYFSSKEDFGLQLIDYYKDFVFSMLDNNYLNSSKSYLERLDHFFDDFLEFLELKNYRGGCPLGNLSQELSDINEKIREKLANVLEELKIKIAEFLKKAQLGNEISSKIDIEKAADFILNSWEGALIRVKVTKSKEPLIIFRDYIFNQLLKQ